MGTLSNNRGNAAQLGLWCVNANNAPSNANANNWGSRQSPQMRNDVSVIAPFDSINHPLKTLPVIARKGCVGQFPLIRRSQVAASRDDGRTDVMRKRRRMAA